jgi:hypothetical protein
MLKLFDERALAVAKQQDIPFLLELIHSPLTIHFRRCGKPLDREP